MSVRVRSSSATLSASNGLDVDITHVDDSVRIGDGTNLVEVDTIGAEKALKVSVIATVGGGSGGTAETDNATFTPSTSSFTPIGGQYDADDSSVLADGKMGTARVTAGRALHVYVAGQAGGASGLTDTELRATALPVSLASVPTHGVTGTFWQATQPVSGTFWQATQPVSGTVTVTGVATQTTLASLLTSSQLLDDVIIADNAAFTDGTTKVNMAGYIYDEVAGTALTENDSAASRIDVKRAQVITLEDETTRGRRLTITASNAAKVDGSAVTQPVSGTFYQATQPISAASLPLPTGAATDAKLDTMITSLQLIDNAMTSVGTDSIAVAGTFWQATQPVSAASLPLPSGASTSALQTSSEAILTTIDADTSSMSTNLTTLAGAITTAKMQVNVITMPTTAVTGTFWQATQPVSGTVAATQSGTWNIGSITTLPALVAGSAAIGKLAANSGVDIGDVDILSMPDAVCTGKAAHDAAVSGNPVRIAGRAMLANGTAVVEDDTCDLATDNQGRAIVTPHAPRDLVTHQTTTITSSTSETTIFTAVASIFLDLTQLVITNSGATATIVTLKDATAGTTRAIFALAANGGIVVNLGTVPMCQATVNNNWTLTCGTSVASIYVYAQAVKRIA